MVWRRAISALPRRAGAADPYSLGPGLHGAENCLFHRPPVGDAALDLLGDRPGHQVSIQLRLADFLDIKLYLLADQRLEVLPHFINPLSAPPDDDAGPGGMESDEYILCLAVNLYQRDAGFRDTLTLMCLPGASGLPEDNSA